MKRIAVVLALALTLAVLPLGVQSQPEPFVIPVALPLTGQAGFIGSQAVKAVAALETLVNRTGGIRGRPVKFNVEDDQTSPQVAVQLMSQFLAAKPAPAVVFGGTLVALCNAAAGLLKDDGPVLYCYSSGVHPPPGSWIYSGNFSTVDMVACAIRFLHDKGITRIGTITTTDASGQDGDRTIAEALALPENASMVVTTKEHFAVSDISADAQLSRLKASGAQAVIAWESGTPLATVLRAVDDTGINVPLVTTPANLIYKQLEQYKSIMPSSPLYIPGIPTVVPNAIGDRGIRQAIAQMAEAIKTQGVDRPDVSTSVVWDAMLIVVNAYRKLGTGATAAQIRDYINDTTHWDGILGVFDYKQSPQRGVLPSWLMMVRWDPNADAFVAVSKPGGAPL